MTSTVATVPPPGNQGAAPEAMVSRARVSISWFALDVSALLPAGDPRPFGRSLSWRALFEDIRNNQAVLLDGRLLAPTPPWIPDNRSTGSDLWNLYASGGPRKRTPTRAAWANLLPIRLEQVVRLAEEEWRAAIHELIYPHGVACVIDAEFHTELPISLPEFCDQALAFRRGPHQFVGSATPTTLDDTAGAVLDRLSRIAFGAAAGSGPAGGDGWDTGGPGGRPFSTVTIVSGHSGPAVSDQDLAQAGRGLTTWLSNWSTATADPKTVQDCDFDDASVRLVSGRDGRLLWAPSLFRPTTGPTTALSDMHRALMWMSVQTDALGSLAAYLVRDDVTELSPTMLSLRRPVGLALGRLRGGAGPVPALHVQAQLTDRGYADAVTTIRLADQLD